MTSDLISNSTTPIISLSARPAAPCRRPTTPCLPSLRAAPNPALPPAASFRPATGRSTLLFNSAPQLRAALAAQFRPLLTDLTCCSALPAWFPCLKRAKSTL